MSHPANTQKSLISQSEKRQKWRMLNDKIAAHGVRLGGMSIIVAITLIFFYLLMVVVPLFESAEIDKLHEYQLVNKGDANSLHYVIDEQGEVGIRITDDGIASSFYTESGEIIAQEQLFEQEVSTFAAADAGSGIVAFGFNNGTALVVKIGFSVSYVGKQRIIKPKYERIISDEPFEIDDSGSPVRHLTIKVDEESASIVSINNSNFLNISRFTIEESMLTDEPTYEQEMFFAGVLNYFIEKVIIDADQRLLFIQDNEGAIYFYDISDSEEVKLIERKVVVEPNSKITDVELAAGGFSLVISKDNGEISQWFPLRNDENQYSLVHVRSFQTGNGSVISVTPEYYRKEFLSIKENGELGIHHMTAHQTLIQQKVSDSPVIALAISPRADFFLIENAEGIQFWHIQNEYPEVSFSSLWAKVWYEGYQEPQHIWQSSSASNDFEPKFSLMPLTFGTIKAAFYAMMIAIPLAILAAIFTAYFMSPKLRQTVKPSIEIMEALPTVILGFLAGLWFAPFLETHMPGVFAICVTLPIGVILFAYLWSRLPKSLVAWVPDGWQPILLLPLIILLSWFALYISPIIEQWLFGGSMSSWLSNEMGIGYDQRNALVVGFAMGFAVIPTIYSIAEDAIFSVPKHLTNGSLALGATQWQTLTRVIILTASPGIFSAVMIGFGRAVGETMIVLMATGNTPVMDFNIFEGMRTLSANIAVEMPESEVGSTHYRVLFLAALILFIFTFMFNTIAELVRQRLRVKYSSL